MLDEDDIPDAVMWPQAMGLVLTLVFLAVILVTTVIVIFNKEECLTKHCERGTPALFHHECVCIEKPLD